MMALILGFGICFELPVLLTLLARTGLITSAQLKHYRPHAIVGLFLVAAVLTPPDPISQVALVPILTHVSRFWRRSSRPIAVSNSSRQMTVHRVVRLGFADLSELLKQLPKMLSSYGVHDDKIKKRI